MSSRYVRAMSWVPEIDISDPFTAMADVSSACERVGFFAVVGHGVSADLIEAIWESAAAFFDLPVEAKMKVAMPWPGYPYGYSPLAGESLAASLGKQGHPDLKESFAIGPVDGYTHTINDPDELFAWSPNLWPEAVPAFREVWESYFRAVANLSARLLQIMAVALDLPRTHFDPMISRHTSAMRALRYPCPENVLPGQLGAGAHTDYGTLTVLLVDPVQGGLQVQDSEGRWHDVRPAPGAFVVNLGDAMARWTNDRWRSTVHRVLVPEGPRQSIAFFHNANWDAVIECVASCLRAGDRPKYAPIHAGPHLMQKFQATVNKNP